MIAGAITTTSRTGRKNTIIGTVSFGGKAAAIFSASVMRWSRDSCADVRRAWPSGVPYFSACTSTVTSCLTPSSPVLS